MKYTTLDNDGLPTAFYSDDIHQNIPKESIEITDEQWLECINNPGKRKFVDKELIEYYHVITDKELITRKVKENKLYLTNTDFKMTVDYFAILTEVEQKDLTNKRQIARDYIKQNTSK